MKGTFSEHSVKHDDDDDDDDEYKLVWPIGLWATSYGGETSKADCTQPFSVDFWQSALLRSSGTC
jgi:hypothetical protein